MKISKILKFILITLVAICIIQFIPNKVEAATKLNLKVSYSYNSKTDVVTVKVKSNIKFKNTKPTWTLSKDKKTYSKKFYANETYSTKFTANNGKSKTVKIKVKQIKGPKITVSYKYDKNTNKVKVTLKSNKQFKDTKPTWNLSKDKKTYTKTFSKNETYTTSVYDKYGNKKNVKIKVTQIDKTGPKVNIKYKYNSNNNTVLVTITANEQMNRNSLNTKWALSKDKKVFTRTFKVNTKFNITLKDKYNNKTKKEINVTQIDETGPKVKVTYKYNSDKTAVDVALTSNEEMKHTNSSWTLSSDKKVYTKKIKSNGTYNIVLQDKYGNKTNTKVKITNLISKGIDVSRHNAKINWTLVKNSGIDFAIIRCGYGKDSTSQDDSTFVYNINECERLKIPYGVYLYSYALDTEGAKSEAKHVLRLIKGHNPKYRNMV